MSSDTTRGRTLDPVNRRATRRFLWVMAPAMLVVLAASLGLDWLEGTLSGKSAETSALLVALAVVPIAALLCTFWAMWRFVMEVDEFLRLIQVKALLIGALTVLVAATGWGYLEAHAGAAALPVFWLNPLFWLGYALAAGVMTWRAGYPL